MGIKKASMVVVAVALPLASVAFLDGTAVAKAVTGTGSVTCHIGGTLNFNPPLSPSGTQTSKEIVTITATFSGCSGGTPAGTAVSTTIKPIKIKGTGKPKTAAACSSIPGAAKTATVKGKVNWTGEKPSKFTVPGLNFGFDSNGEADFTGSGSGTGSYAGSVALHVDLNATSTAALAACVGGSPGSISSAAIDTANSTITQ